MSTKRPSIQRQNPLGDKRDPTFKQAVRPRREADRLREETKR